MAPSRLLTSLFALPFWLALPLLASQSLAAPPPAPGATAKPSATSTADIYEDKPAKSVYDEQEEADRAAQARKLFSDGVTASDEGRWPDAYDALSKAWKLKEHWQIAYYLSKAEIRTGRFRAAIPHLDITLAADHDDARAVRVECLELREKARTSLAYVRVTGTPIGARVLVDGELRGKLPLSGPVEVDPGARDVVLRLGDLSVSTRIVLQGGQTMEARLNLPTPEIKAPPPPPPQRPSQLPLILGLSGAGVGVLGAIAGTALWTGAVQNDLLVSLARGAPPSPTRDKLIAEAGALSQSETAGAITLWIVGGACLLGGLGYWAYPSLMRPSPAAPAAPAVVPVLSPHHAGLAVTGAW